MKTKKKIHASEVLTFDDHYRELNLRLITFYKDVCDKYGACITVEKHALELLVENDGILSSMRFEATSRDLLDMSGRLKVLADKLAKLENKK